MAPTPEVRLMLVDDGVRWLDTTPNDVAVGAIRLRAWQLTPVVPRLAALANEDAYLVKVNYELVLEPEVPAPRWFEIGFEFCDPGSAAEVTVVDALPHTVLARQPATSYAVGDDLGFVPGDRLALPPVAAVVDVFGIGGPHVRWRHRSADGTRPGSYVSWIALAAPRHAEHLEVRMNARYDLDPDDALGLLPATGPESFRLALMAAPHSAPMDTSPKRTTTGKTDRPRVFVSYAHDNERHIEAVRRFCEFLADCGIDVHVDRWDLDRRRDWYEWAIDQITNANFIIVVASPDCRAVGDGAVPPDRNRGLQSEITLLRELLHRERPTWRTRILPVVLAGQSVNDIPIFLQPYSADHYMVTNLTVDGAIDLLRALTGQPAFTRPRVADHVVKLPAG